MVELKDGVGGGGSLALGDSVGLREGVCREVRRNLRAAPVISTRGGSTYCLPARRRLQLIVAVPPPGHHAHTHNPHQLHTHNPHPAPLHATHPPPTGQVEFILMGGTFMSLPTEYRDYFVRNLHDALSGHTSKDVYEAVRCGVGGQGGVGRRQGGVGGSRTIQGWAPEAGGSTSEAETVQSLVPSWGCPAFCHTEGFGCAPIPPPN